MRTFRITTALLFLFLINSGFSLTSIIEYCFPLDNSDWINADLPIILRFSRIYPSEIVNLETCITVHGQKSGHIDGNTIVSSDEKTVLFKPFTPYLHGDKIEFRVTPRLHGESVPLCDTTFSFFVAPVQLPDQKPMDENSTNARSQTNTPVTRDSDSQRHKQYPSNADGVILLNGVSVPSDFPYIDITIKDNPDPGYIFCKHDGDRYFNLILDNDGAPVFYWIVPDDRRDFKVQPTGDLTMTVREGFGGGGFIAVDKSYTVVDTFFAPAGLQIDEHELLVLPNGHYLVTAMETRTMDMSQIVAGGKRNAQVIGYHLIEMDTQDNPVFIWRCWDHYQVTDAEYVDLTQNWIDYLHTNSIAVDLDGHYLTSPKLLNEITKINRHTGEIMWRLGGKNNQFALTNMDELFSMQHSIRVLPNGNYMLFDNGNYHEPHYSRALEFKVNTENMTVTRVWEFRDTPDKQSHYKGNVQRLPNGNTLISWGMADLPQLTEVRPDGSKAFEMHFEIPVQCYRVFRFPWQANAAAPFLVVEDRPNDIVLLYNKFGDPDVQEYRVYGGSESGSTRLLRSTPEPYAILNESDFTESDTYYFRITAMDSKGNESAFSNEERVVTNYIPANVNLVRNAGFSSGDQNWDFFVGGTASATFSVIGGESVISVEQAGSAFEDIRLIQGNLTLYQGQTYLFEFEARADESRAIDARIESTLPPYSNYGQIGLSSLKTRQDHYSYQFTMTNATTHQARVFLGVGQGNGTVYIDNISLKRITPSAVASTTGSAIPSEAILHPTYPNPFNAQVKIPFSLPEESVVSVEIFDLLGRRIGTVVEDRFSQGYHTRSWSAEKISSGIYFCRLEAQSVVSGRKTQQMTRMVFVR